MSHIPPLYRGSYEGWCNNTSNLNFILLHINSVQHCVLCSQEPFVKPYALLLTDLRLEELHLDGIWLRLKLRANPELT
ncbi:hypothetical protein OUZ56_018149 [Daphnia magna]|uniref:Uncharacterized protein n=1 Tax=Daphnia magna TaxID=35525 RepID=A0ABQ9Z8D1_9CRUS|nr:hypothetical protein OUZ56_018149 [Daphnia magna]